MAARYATHVALKSINLLAAYPKLEKRLRMFALQTLAQFLLGSRCCDYGHRKFSQERQAKRDIYAVGIRCLIFAPVLSRLFSCG